MSTVLTRRPPMTTSRRLPGAAPICAGVKPASAKPVLVTNIPAVAPANCLRKALRLRMVFSLLPRGWGSAFQADPRVTWTLNIARRLLTRKNPVGGIRVRRASDVRREASNAEPDSKRVDSRWIGRRRRAPVAGRDGYSGSGGDRCALPRLPGASSGRPLGLERRVAGIGHRQLEHSGS